ncbi:putative agmatinase 2 [Glarea lozoyensis 74030]|uniref:Putative agmatinase 2 n=1 Tax=Glarea lozoyensis (strain ATCC 74030 / MF5533) TaxID=1104152 RepID=H0EP78_GLAL7|nr:putative agmatinase 2 [Glarea lozoyensis 74030]
MSGLKFLDCGDIPVTAYDNALALSQMTMAFLELGSRPPLKKNDIDEIGTQGIIEAIIKRIGTTLPVYLSFDIDVLDPSVCPGTGTPESGGWTSREVIKILRGLESLNVVGADILEVAPAYDSAGEQTALVAAQVAFEILASWAGRYMANQEQTSGSEPEKNEL